MVKHLAHTHTAVLSQAIEKRVLADRMSCSTSQHRLALCAQCPRKLCVVLSLWAAIETSAISCCVLVFFSELLETPQGWHLEGKEVQLVSDGKVKCQVMFAQGLLNLSSLVK